jgi:hypothetical protein
MTACGSAGRVMTVSVVLNKEEEHLNRGSGSLWFDNLWVWLLLRLRLLKIRTVCTIICARNTRRLTAIASNLIVAQSGKHSSGTFVKIRRA